MNLYGLSSAQQDEKIGVIGRDSLDVLTKEIYKIEQIRHDMTPKEHMINIVAFHHHVIPLPGIVEKAWLEDAGDVLRRLIDLPVSIVLTGHKHVTSCDRLDNTLFINTGTFSSKKILNPYGNTFNIIDLIDDTAIVVHEFSIQLGTKRLIGVYPIKKGTSVKNPI